MTDAKPDQSGISRIQAASPPELKPDFQLYQAVYHHLTSKTEKIAKSFDKAFLLRDSDIEQLVTKLDQLSQQYNVTGVNTSIVVFHENDVTETFSSLERFRLYNKSNSNPVAAIQINRSFLYSHQAMIAHNLTISL